jgi:hypothetical protein
VVIFVFCAVENRGDTLQEFSTGILRADIFGAKEFSGSGSGGIERKKAYSK